MDTTQRILAKKYAQAFLNISSHIVTPQIVDAIEQFVIFMKQRKKALFYVQLALLDDVLKKETLLKVLHQFRLDGVFKELIDILIVHRRLVLLPSVFDFIVQLHNERLGKLEFTVESSHELSQAQLHTLKEFVTAQTHKKITLLPRIDKTLIAGIRLINPAFEWEYSVRKQLRAFSHIRHVQ